MKIGVCYAENSTPAHRTQGSPGQQVPHRVSVACAAREEKSAGAKKV
jgi:hypothetical protein